jgi:uncharacterized protein (TIGR02117 family)
MPITKPPKRIPRPPRLRPSSRQTVRNRVCASAIALLWASSSCIAQPASVSPLADAGASSSVYIARRGWHTDIGLAISDLAPPLDAVAAKFGGVRYIFFGFADKHYLSAKNHNAPTLLAALWPGGAVILVTALSGSPDQAFGASHVIHLTLREDQMRALRTFLWNSFVASDQTLSVYKEGPYEGSLYYLGRAKYSAFHTCNTWAAQALRAAGLRVHTTGVIFAGQLWSQARRLRRDEQSGESSRASLLVALPNP